MLTVLVGKVVARAGLLCCSPITRYAALKNYS